jgi:haloalkane dehalogenase
MDLYRRPLEDSGNGKATLALMRMVADGPDHASSPALRDIERFVEGLDIPAELVWGMNDPILGRGLPFMQTMFPTAPVTETEAGHFLQEEVPEIIAAALLRIVDKAQKN